MSCGGVAGIINTAEPLHNGVERPRVSCGVSPNNSGK